MAQAKITFEADTSPALLFIKLFGDSLKSLNRTIKTGELPRDLVRLDQIFNPTNASKIFVRLYPSDTFLRFAAATLASEYDLSVINDPAHNKKPPRKGFKKQ